MEQQPVKAVRIMCDYSATGVWPEYTLPGSSRKGFRVSDALWERIQCWQDWYERQWPGEGTGEELDLPAFNAEGWAIARAVKAELPDWRVFFWEEADWISGDGTPTKLHEIV